MNKKLIALAVAGACVAPAAIAQTANPVTLYGSLRVELEYAEFKGTGAPASRTRIYDHPSVLGVRGTEDLGGGLKAFFQLETAFDADNASGTFANRNSGVGLQGGWGSVLLGRWDMPMKQVFGAIDPWGDINRADYTAAHMDQGNFSRRTPNVVQYWSPSWGGFSVKLASSTDEDRTATAKPRTSGASVNYTRGPLTVAYAYEEHKDQVGATVTAGRKEEGNVVGARFAVGPVRLTGMYGEYKKTGLAKEKSYYLGADFTMGKSVLVGSYQNAEIGSADCDVWGIGWQYNFSRRTNIMLSYGHVENSRTMNCAFGAGPAIVPVGGEADGFGLGVRHYF